MSNHYSPQDFFRRVPNKLLGQHFANKGILTDIDFKKLPETQVESLYEAWRLLPDDVRNQMEAEFQVINDMATEGGCKAILDEANYHGEDLAGVFAAMDGSFFEHVFWTFLERPNYWKGAEAFYYADTIANSYWSKYKNLPLKPADISPNGIEKLEKGLGEFLFTNYARGKNCKVECYKRDNLDYFFAFPEDYAHSAIEWENKELKRRSHRPAFEIIFLYSQSEGKLDIYVPKDKKMISDLHRFPRVNAGFLPLQLHTELT